MAIKKNISHKKNKRRYLGTRSIEWMLGQIQNKSVSRGDICRFNDRDYVFNGKEWKLMSWNLSKSNNVKSDNTNAVSDVIQRMESAGTMDGQAVALKKKNFKRECHGIYGNQMLDYC